MKDELQRQERMVSKWLPRYMKNVYWEDPEKGAELVSSSFSFLPLIGTLCSYVFTGGEIFSVCSFVQMQVVRGNAEMSLSIMNLPIFDSVVRYFFWLTQ